MKALPKKDLKVGDEARENGHWDKVVEYMLYHPERIVFVVPYLTEDGEVVPNWYTDIRDDGFNWHISWLDVIE